MPFKYFGLERMTYREQDEDNVLNDVSTSVVANSHQCTPAPPVFALCHTVLAPATKCFVQVELSSIVYIAADACLQVSHPVARNIYTSSNATNGNASRNEDQPYLARVREHSQLSEQAGSISQEMLKAHALLAILVYPIDRREVIVTHTPSRALDIPVKTRGILIVL